jgi:hypothetical protein
MWSGILRPSQEQWSGRLVKDRLNIYKLGAGMNAQRFIDELPTRGDLEKHDGVVRNENGIAETDRVNRLIARQLVCAFPSNTHQLED